MWVGILAFVILLGFLALVGFGLQRTQEGHVQVGQSVPPFPLQTFDGQTINTTDLKGKVVLVNFWASWCKPCEAEAAELQQAWEYYQPLGNTVFLGVDYVDTSAYEDYEKPEGHFVVQEVEGVTPAEETFAVDEKVSPEGKESAE